MELNLRYLLLVFFSIRIFANDLLSMDGQNLFLNPIKNNPAIENNFLSANVKLISPKFKLNGDEINLQSVDLLSLNSIQFNSPYLDNLKISFYGGLDQDYSPNGSLNLYYNFKFYNFKLKTLIQASFDDKKEIIFVPNLDISREISDNASFGTILERDTDNHYTINPYLNFAINKKLNFAISYTKSNDDSIYTKIIIFY